MEILCSVTFSAKIMRSAKKALHSSDSHVVESQDKCSFVHVASMCPISIKRLSNINRHFTDHSSLTVAQDQCLSCSQKTTHQWLSLLNLTASFSLPTNLKTPLPHFQKSNLPHFSHVLLPWSLKSFPSEFATIQPSEPPQHPHPLPQPLPNLKALRFSLYPFMHSPLCSY